MLVERGRASLSVSVSTASEREEEEWEALLKDDDGFLCMFGEGKGGSVDQIGNTHAYPQRTHRSH